MRRLLLLVACVSGSGCVTLESMSSGEVGCPPESITVSDQKSSLGGRTWTAQCDGKTYYCSLHGGEGSQTSCTPAGGPAAGGGAVPPEPSGAVAPEPAESGCSFDQQCKGDRICEEGACVDPPVSAPPPPVDPEPAPPPPATPEATPPPAG